MPDSSWQAKVFSRRSSDTMPTNSCRDAFESVSAGLCDGYAVLAIVIVAQTLLLSGRRKPESKRANTSASKTSVGKTT
ncbi:hypothetical protein EJ03DRAFT_196842 [Teratosphaeria nubilosa]|uniref:Uncharacterized protein n=1 Tax=Teratosphaeria nubilosa TaxID=161662 RepID=A0A6G1KYY0_9PEZI|nr:hypothetical protein EJ03DRAFT_196842 [Teratosphaeria nubilosa]